MERTAPAMSSRNVSVLEGWIGTHISSQLKIVSRGSFVQGNRHTGRLVDVYEAEHFNVLCQLRQCFEETSGEVVNKLFAKISATDKHHFDADGVDDILLPAVGLGGNGRETDERVRALKYVYRGPFDIEESTSTLKGSFDKSILIVSEPEECVEGVAIQRKLLPFIRTWHVDGLHVSGQPNGIEKKSGDIVVEETHQGVPAQIGYIADWKAFSNNQMYGQY